jgi:hypothetical protein
MKLKSNGPFPAGIRTLMGKILKTVKGITDAGLGSTKMKKRVELIDTFPTEDMLLYSKSDETYVKCVSVPTRQAAQRTRMKLLQEELYRTYASANSTLLEMQQEISDFIDGTDKSKEWPAENREELKKDLQDWLMMQTKEEDARYREELARIEANADRNFEKVKTAMEHNKQIIASKLQSMKEKEKLKKETLQQMRTAANARREVGRAASIGCGSPPKQNNETATSATTVATNTLAAAETTRIMTQMRQQIQDLRNEVTATALDKESLMTRFRAAESQYNAVCAERDALRGRTTN